MSAPNSASFDTHRFVKRMTEAGMPLAQAEALAEEQGVMVNTHFATKQDTTELRHGIAEVGRRLGHVENRVVSVENRVANVENRVVSVENRVVNVERDVGELKQDVGELKTGLAVVRAELGMVKWMVSGVGAGMLLLLVRTFWPV